MADAKKVETKPEAPTVEAKIDTKEASPAKGKTLVVRLLADYWDAEGNRQSCAYVDDNGEWHETGALLELPAVEARALVKTAAAERGDDY